MNNETRQEIYEITYAAANATRFYGVSPRDTKEAIMRSTDRALDSINLFLRRQALMTDRIRSRPNRDKHKRMLIMMAEFAAACSDLGNYRANTLSNEVNDTVRRAQTLRSHLRGL